LGTLLGYFCKSKWYYTNCFEKLEVRNAQEKKQKFHLFSNAKGRLEVWKTIFLRFQIENKITNMYKISCLHPIGPPTLLLSLALTMVVHVEDGGQNTFYDDPMYKQNSKF
jgi:hypothetical protein